MVLGERHVVIHQHKEDKYGTTINNGTNKRIYETNTVYNSIHINIWIIQWNHNFIIIWTSNKLASPQVF